METERDHRNILCATISVLGAAVLSKNASSWFWWPADGSPSSIEFLF